MHEDKPLLTIRVNEYNEQVCKITSTGIESVEIYAGAFDMNGFVKSMGVQFRLPSTLIYDIIERECHRSGSSAAMEFLEEIKKAAI